MIVYNNESLRPVVKEIYQTIIGGIREGYGDAQVIELTDAVVDESAAEVAVVLGNYAVRQALAMELALPLVVGATSWSTDGVHGVSVTADPTVVFQKLQALVPEVEHVYMVLDANRQLLDIANLVTSGQRYGIEVIIEQATDIREAAAIYGKFLTKLRSEDALWIPPGDRFVNKALLSRLLLKSWRWQFAVISSNPSYVGKGALFSVSPDYHLMGKRLGQLARQLADGSIQPAKIQSLKDVVLSVNQKMANHIGIRLDKQLPMDQSIQLR